MDEAWVGIVAEVQRCEVEEIDDQDDLGPDKVRADKQHHKGEVQQVVEDEMASDRACRIDVLDLTREEVSDVAELEDEEDEPGRDKVSMCVCELGGDGWKLTSTATWSRRSA